MGWQAVDIGEEIPYGTVFVDEPRPLTEEEVAWAHEVIEEYLGRQLFSGSLRQVLNL